MFDISYWTSMVRSYRLKLGSFQIVRYVRAGIIFYVIIPFL